MKISCIIPTCDRNEFLLESIDSILAQTYSPYEILVINNGQSHIELPTEILNKVKTFNIFPYAGVAQARNFGALMSQGDYLAFLDDDDLWHPRYLENIKIELEKDYECIISRLDKLENSQILPHKNCHHKLTFEHLLNYNPGITGSNLVIKKDIFMKLGGYDVLLPPSEDKSLIIEALKNNIKIKTLPDNQAIIRIHSNERLSSADKMAHGIYQFVYKYSPLMNRKTRLANWLKIYRHRYMAGHTRSFIPFLYLYIIFRFIKLKEKTTKVLLENKKI